MKRSFFWTLIFFLLVGVVESVKSEEQDIFSAIVSKDLKAIRNVLNKDPKAVNARNTDGDTPLTLLSKIQSYNALIGINKETQLLNPVEKKEYPSVAKLLIDNGADVNAKDKHGATSLHWAALKGKYPLSVLLIEKGANVNAGILSEDPDLGNTTPLHLAAKKGYVKIVKLLLSKGAEVDSNSKNGQTSLHLAAFFGHLNTVELLIEKGAEVNIKNNNDQTPLSLALEEKNNSISEFLLKKGAKK